MEKKYFADFYFYVCPKCKKQSHEKRYFAVYDKAEIGAARRAGLLTYKCSSCGANHNSGSVLTNGDVVEVTPEEAISNGIGFESKGEA